MANVLTVVWFVIGWIISQVGAMVLFALLFPNRVALAQHQLTTRPRASVGIGFLFWAASAFLTVLLLQAGKAAPLQLLGWLCSGPMLISSLLGGAAVARLAAERIRQEAPEASSFACLVGGALCLALAGLVPVLGWFGVLPLFGWASVGAGLTALWPRRRPRVTVQPAAPPEPAPAASGYADPSAALPS
ncbi:MAG: hypothetical protein FJX77_08840 [Armatimonadetes bacterium]|nr:hypothetical protein [Armatimonadota bacterium]